MKVKIISTYGQRCGISFYAEGLARALAVAGCTVHVVGEDAEFRPEFAAGVAEDGIEITRGWRRHGARFDPDGAPCDVLHVQHETSFWMYGDAFEKAIEAERRAGARAVVVTVHTPVPNGLGPSVLATIEARADCLVTLGARGQDAMQSWMTGPDKTHVIPHPVCAHRDPTLADLAQVQHEFGLDGRPLFVCVGFLAAAKGLFTVVEAASYVPDVQVVIAGAPAEHELGNARYVKALQGAGEAIGSLRVHPGFVDDDRLTALYHLAQAAIVPCVGWSESASLATAFGHGLPALIIGPPSADSYESGGTTYCGSSADLAARLDEFSTSDAPNYSLRHLCKEVTQIAQARTWPAAAQSHIELYEAALEGKCASS